MEYFSFFYTAFGLVIGSFLNVCIYRLPRRESIVFPGSHCPDCGKGVRPYDNLPVISYLILRGKCRFCRRPISLQYPLVEALAGAAFYACAATWGASPPTFVNSLFLSVILVLIVTDYHHQILPNALTIPGAIAGILLSPLQAAGFLRDPNDVLSYDLAFKVSALSAESILPWVSSAIGAMVGGGMLLLVSLGYQAVRKKQGLGMGDVKMMAMVGAFLGWRLAFLTVLVGSMLGLSVGIYLILFRGKTLQAKLPFGTFLGAAAVLALFFGISFLGWYVPA